MSQPLDLGSLSAEQLAELKQKATAQLAETHRRGRFALFKPLEHQRPWFLSKKQIIAAIGGNQMGKTTCGAIRLLSGALGTFPPSLGGTIPSSWERLDCRGQRYLMVAESFNTVIAKTIFPKINEYLTQEMQSRPPKKNAGTKLPEIIYLRSGSEIHVQSYEQDPASFEGPTWDGVWFDEPPPQAVFNAVRRGTIARKGWIWLTATPLREAWVRDMIVMPAQDEDDPMNEFADVFGGKMHDNCCLEGERVSGRFTGGLKARYSGPAVEVMTASGNRLRVTAQHPVLTTRGLVPAASLDKGDTLLAQRREIGRAAPGGQVEQQEPADATVEEVFDALRAQTGLSGRRDHRGVLDLDGDERFFLGDEIDAVGLLVGPTERRLVRDGERQDGGDLGFPLSESASTVVVSGRSGLAASGLPGPGQHVLDVGPVTASVAPPQGLRLGWAAKFDARLPQSALHSLLIASRFASELLHRFASDISLDEVREVRHFDYSGHVYDFSTEVGYFASGNLLIRNCADCYGGYLPHAYIIAYLASLPAEERAVRERGEFFNVSDLAFGNLSEQMHVVGDLW